MNIFSQKHREQGQSLVEYIALTALVAIVSITTVKVFGGKVKSRLNQITTTFDRNIQQGLKAHASRRSSDDEGDDEDNGGWPGGIKLPRGIRLPKGLPFPDGLAFGL